MTAVIMLLFLFNFSVVVFNLNLNFAIKLFHERAYCQAISLILCCQCRIVILVFLNGLVSLILFMCHEHYGPERTADALNLNCIN